MALPRLYALALSATLLALAACDSADLRDAPAAGPAVADALSGPVALSGAVFTTEQACDGTNVNIFASKDAVHLDGGPRHAGSAGLPDGEYYVRVTAPNGDLLGTSVGAADETPAVVVGGEFAACYQLSAVLVRASDGAPGYDTTPNNGGEYKVWVSRVATFAPSASKTDNFKVNETCTGDCDPDPPSGSLEVQKFYDADADGVRDGTEPYLAGWKVNVDQGIGDQFTPWSDAVEFGTYGVSEYMPAETNWVATTGGVNPTRRTVEVTEAAPDGYVEFGNVCLGAGGGHTLGFWSNRNGTALISGADYSALVALNLRNANGSDFNPTSSTFRSWILGASATNMAYMLSAQLAAMKLNTLEPGFVSGGALVYAPGTTSASALGFATVDAVMAEADALLGANGSIVSGSPDRARAEALKNALDRGNNNFNFVQGTACPFTF